MRKELSKVYDPHEVEGRIYQQWEETSASPASGMPKEASIPSSCLPNVTGQLHMGHAMDCTLQDILIRFKRMQGYAALWVPAPTTPASPPRSRWRRSSGEGGPDPL
ncbi:MAG: class I tRNA ligase family protein [Evtepia gabavorous]